MKIILKNIQSYNCVAYFQEQRHEKYTGQNGWTSHYRKKDQ